MKKYILILFIMTSFFIYGKEFKYDLKLGGLVKSQGTVYKGIETKTYLAPYIYFKYKRFTFDGDRCDINIFNKGINMSINGKFNYDGYESSKSDYLSNMENRESGFLAGLNVSYFNKKTGTLVRADLDGDISGNSEGFAPELELAQFLPLRKNLYLKSSVTFKYMNSNYGNYYYGLSESEADESLGEYSISDSHSEKLKFTLIYILNENLNVVGVYEVERVSDKIYNSPVVDERLKNMMFLMVSYKV